MKKDLIFNLKNYVQFLQHFKYFFRIIILAVLFLPNSNWSFEAPEIRGNWFSKLHPLETGFYVHQLNLAKDKFYFSRLSYNQYKKWEETRFTGFVEKTKNGYTLKSKMCAVYSCRKLGDRWALIRVFDCDYVRFSLTKKSYDKLKIFPDSNLYTEEYFKRWEEHRTDTYQSIVIQTDGYKFTSWGPNVYKIRKNANAFIIKSKSGEKIKVKVVENAETTGVFRDDQGRIEVGDILVVENKKRAGGGFFE